MPDQDTIVAISTPPGRGGIGIVRLSGPEALTIAAHLLALKSPLEHARARFTQVLDDSAETLDALLPLLDLKQDRGWRDTIDLAYQRDRQRVPYKSWRIRWG